MNSTHSFSVKKISADYKHYVLTLDYEGGKKFFFFSNASGFEKREECMGVEIDKYGLAGFSKKFLNRNYDFSVYGDFDFIQVGKYKISFTINCKFLSGNYVLLKPAWGRNTNYKMWVLIPSNKLK